MSLLGRLEDLSLPDIVQIVFLSRRTGILEIIDDNGRHTVLFRQGLIVNASSPASPDLLSDLITRGLVPRKHEAALRETEEDTAVGTYIVEMKILAKEALADAIRSRVMNVINPLLGSQQGEFNFILSDSVGAVDMEYDPDQIFGEGGLKPQEIFGGEGEKLKPLRGLEESLKAGKALLRGSGGPIEASAPPRSFPEAPLPPEDDSDNLLPFPGSAPGEDAPTAPFEETLVPQTGPDLEPMLKAPFSEAPGHAAVPAPAPTQAESPTREPRFKFKVAAAPPVAPAFAPDSPAPEAPEAEALTEADASTKRRGGKFKVAGGLIEVTSPEAASRNVVLFERNPLLRVAAKRAFSRSGVKIEQFGSIGDVQDAIAELIRTSSFFVTYLELTPQDREGSGPSTQILQRLKRKNQKLPVVVIDEVADLRRRQRYLREGADLYLTKPTEERMQPGLVEQELASFADELVLFADRAFAQWSVIAGGRDPREAGRRFYNDGEKAQVDRSFDVLKQLINELSNPNDISQVALTILRLADEYLDRGVLFVVGESEFRGIGGFGTAGGEESLAQKSRSVRIPRSAASVLEDVVEKREGHRGKMRRTPANVELIERMGGLLPTEVLVLPLMHEFKVIGILYGDNAENRAPIDATIGLEIFLSQAGYAFGNAVIASRNAGLDLDR
jgi:CheY-like chemotaxis protein